MMEFSFQKRRRRQQQNHHHHQKQQQSSSSYLFLLLILLLLVSNSKSFLLLPPLLSSSSPSSTQSKRLIINSSSSSSSSQLDATTRKQQQSDNNNRDDDKTDKKRRNTGANNNNNNKRITKTTRSTSNFKTIRRTEIFVEKPPMAVKQVLPKQQSQHKQQQNIDNESQEENNENNINDNSGSSSSENPNNTNTNNTNKENLPTTISGGQALLFEMARKMLVWDENVNDASTSAFASTLSSSPGSSSSTTSTTTTAKTTIPNKTKKTTKTTKVNVLPRWHPHGGISDINQNFRTSPPVMNNQGYAGTIWRNARKRNKPSLWRHSLRTYERMKNIEEEQQRLFASKKSNIKQPKLRIKRTNIHYEGALVACSKLGLWEEAFQIYIDVIKNSNFNTINTSSSSSSSSSSSANVTTMTSQSQSLPASPSPPPVYNNTLIQRLRTIQVSDNMIMAIIKACIRGCKKMNVNEYTLEERRKPLDECQTLILDVENNHGLPLTSSYINPLASAYQSIGLYNESNNLINHYLSDRNVVPKINNEKNDKKKNEKQISSATTNSNNNIEDEKENVYEDNDEEDLDFDDDDDIDRLNINNIKCKDKASYAMLVTNAISNNDYVSAIEELTKMTDNANLYPTSKYLNIWTEVSERKTKNRNTRSRKKKRDSSWLSKL